MINMSKITIQKTLACITLTCVFLTYQNCGTSSFDTLEFSSCIPGERLKVSLLNSTKTAKYVNVVSYSGEHNARYNYNYFSYSANPIHGPEPVDGKINIFFYKDSRGLNFSFYANVDQGEVRAEEFNYVDMDIEINGNSLEDQVIISDDDLELKKVSQNFYEGRFAYNSNTDGGVIGPIGVDGKFEIVVKFLNREGNVITDARFFSASGENFILKNEENGDIESFKITYDGYSDCDE